MKGFVALHVFPYFLDIFLMHMFLGMEIKALSKTDGPSSSNIF